MLTINETVDKLYKQPERFEQCMDAGITAGQNGVLSAQCSYPALSNWTRKQRTGCLGCLRKKK